MLEPDSIVLWLNLSRTVQGKLASIPVLHRLYYCTSPCQDACVEFVVNGPQEGLYQQELQTLRLGSFANKSGGIWFGSWIFTLVLLELRPFASHLDDLLRQARTAIALRAFH